MREALVDIVQPLLDLPVVPVTLDFERVDSINSLAIADWVAFLRKFATSRPVNFARCSPVIVSTMNLISSFAGRCEVESVVRHYVCGAGHRTAAIIELVPGNIPDSDEAPCSNCSLVARAEQPAEEYFQFLTRNETKQAR